MSSIVEKVVDAVTPAPSEEDRAKAREKARAAARPGDWLALVVQQHVQIENAFDNAKSAMSEDGRKSAFKELAIVLMGHSIAEEAVLYPAMKQEGESGYSHAYEEQIAAKEQMAKLETLEPLSQEWTDTLDATRKAVLHHMYSEEGTWFPKLHKDAASDAGRLTRRFTEEYERYTHERM